MSCSRLNGMSHIARGAIAEASSPHIHIRSLSSRKPRRGTQILFQNMSKEGTAALEEEGGYREAKSERRVEPRRLVLELRLTARRKGESSVS